MQKQGRAIIRAFAILFVGMIAVTTAGCHSKEDKPEADYYSGKDFQRPNSAAKDEKKEER